MKDAAPLFAPINGSKLKIGIVLAKWNNEVTTGLLIGALQALNECKVLEKNITVVEVAGAYELPFAAKTLIQSKKKFDAVITLGCLIKGETMHFEYIASSVAQGLMELNVDEDIPVVFGVLTCLNEKQAVVRSRGKHNHGYGWGYTAVEMALLKTKV